MKLDVAFSELNQTIPAAFSESNVEFNSPMSEFVTLHDSQNGATFYPFVSEDCVLSWTNDRELDNPPPVNIRGKNGYTPIKGTDYWTEEDKSEIISNVLSRFIDVSEVGM